MNHPPASERNYWDRILKLAKGNGGSFTLDQIHEEFDLSSREMKKIKKLTERSPKAYDAADKYEFAKDVADAWAALISSEIHQEKINPSPDLQRIEGLTELWFAARHEILFVDFDDEEAVYAIELKCEALHQILLHVEKKGASMAGSNPYLLSEAENERIFRKEILPKWLNDAGPNLHSVERPQMVIIGGQPGAGKSHTMGGVERELMHQGGALKISPDEFREKHPNFKQLNAVNDRTSSSFTHEDAGIWAEKLEKYGREHKLNVILEGTLRMPTHQRHHELALVRPQHLDPQNITL